ncbi:MAG: RNA polymerase II elongation factor [Thelocarpon superellum]|nr:MAG: RNA polymerase II elongation factor [Thelocarpon superellum]
MDAKEIAASVRSLNKAAAGGEPASNILTILQSLKKGVQPTEDLLRSTKVGVAVNRQKQHADKEVARLASEIVSKWRDDVNKPKAGMKKAATTPPKSSNGDAAAANGTSTAASEGKSTVPPDQRNWKKDKVDVKRTSNTTRDNCLGLLYDGIAYCTVATPTVVLKRAIDIERAAMTEYGPETESAYKNKMRALFQNLKNKSNSELRERVISGEISAERLVVMTHDELKSAERRAEDQRLQEANMKDAMVPKAERSISTAFVCGKCGQKKVSYSQAQTRSADEPMTTFCECQICGNRWKVSWNGSSADRNI